MPTSIPYSCEDMGMSEQPFRHHRAAALAILNGTPPPNRKVGRFLGQIAVDPAPLTSKQAEWLKSLLERSKLPPLIDGGLS